MPMDEHKRTLAMQPEWPVEIAADYFDLPPDEVRRLMGAPDASNVDRFQLEKKLRQEERISLDWLSLEFGVPRDALEEAMHRPPTGIGAFPLAAYGSGERFLLPRKLAEAWVKELLPKHKVWSSLDSRARDLAARLGCPIRECAVSRRFGDTPLRSPPADAS
jgi:hypothetical protein